MQKVIQVVMQRTAKRAQREARRAYPATHVLFASGHARRPGNGDSGAGGHQDLATTQRYMHLSPAALDAAIRLLETGSADGPPSPKATAGQLSQ
jgi:hypothetical protein